MIGRRVKVNHKEVVSKIMKDQGLTQQELAVRIGANSQSSIAEALKRQITLSKFWELMDALDFEIVVRRKRTSEKEGEYKVCGTDMGV